MNRRYVFSTIAIMAMSLVGCNRSANEDYVKQLNDSIATLNVELMDARAALEDCQKSKQVQPAKKKNKKAAKKKAKQQPAKANSNSSSNANASADATVTQAQSMTVGDCQAHVENVQNTIEMGCNNQNNTVVINNGIINNYNATQTATATPSAASDADAKPDVRVNCKISGNINVKVTHNINVKTR